MADTAMAEAPLALVYLPRQSQALARELEQYRLACLFAAAEDEREAAERITAAEILIAEPLSASVLERARHLRWIQSLAAGVERWLAADLPTDLPITRMVGAFERYMAEYVFAHLLRDTQQVEALAEAQGRRDWARIQTRSLAGMRLGVAGLGHIGSAIATVGKAFGMEVWGLRRRPISAAERGQPADRVFDRSGLDEFLAGCDVIVAVMPATPQTQHMFGAREFASMKAGAVFINIGRGALVDEAALVDALRSGHLSRAIVDTFSTEPLPADSPLWITPRLTITPHMAGAGYADELARLIAPNVAAFLLGTIPGPTVDRDAGY